MSAGASTAALRVSTRRRGLVEELRSIDGRRLSLEETLKAVAVPPVVYNKCPRVEHFLAGFTGRVSAVVAEALHLPEPFIDELVRFGAVYTCPVIPDTSPSLALLSPTSRQALEELRSEAVSRVGRHPKFRQPQRAAGDQVVHEHAYCRVHVHPKRFPAFYEHDWSTRVILENDHCVVVNKPPGCQVPPRVDNRLECLTTWIQGQCGAEAELKPVHRLDTGTEGVVVLAKTAEFARYFQSLLLRGGNAVEKGYRALTANAPPLGPLRHYIEANHHVKGRPRRSRVFLEPTDGAAYAELTITATHGVPLVAQAREKWNIEEAYESSIDLKTGRTHQIRVQLAQEGCPLLGDGLYQAPSDLESPFDVPDGCIGLQAATLTLRDAALGTFFDSVEGRTLRLSAGDPWWRMH